MKLNSVFKYSFSRRKVIAVSGIGLANYVSRAPQVFARKKYKIRVLGTHATLQEPIRRQASADLGIDLEFFPAGSAEVLYQATVRPDSFDVYEQWSNSINILWQSKAIQPLDISRIRYWDDVNQLTKEGRLDPKARLGAGDNPNKILYVQNNHLLGSRPTGQISYVPYVHNADSYAYRPPFVSQGMPYDTESWGLLLDRRYRGRCGIINAPTIGLFDLLLASQAMGAVDFVDLGNPSRTELGKLFDLLIQLKQEGHFRGFWSSIPESASFMENDDVVIQSMFSPAVTALNNKGIRCIYAAPKEGYRAWHGVLCLSSRASGQVKDAAYEYMNWWLSGWPGAFVAKQGYYISTPQLSRSYLNSAEWSYWYQGLASSRDLLAPDGSTAIKKGAMRNGGSYETRFSNIAVWNSVIPQYEHLLLKWKELLLA